MAYRIKIVNLDTDEVEIDVETNCVFAAINDKKNAAIKSHSFNRLRPYNAFIYIYGLAVIGVRAVSKESHYRNF